MALFKKLSVAHVLLLGMLLNCVSIKAQQCTGCTTVISGGSSNFSVNVGQVVCISPGITYTGNITLNGGTLCNEGTLTRIIFKKGTFNNYGSFMDVNSLSINTNGILRIFNYGGATFSVGTGVSLVSTNLSDSVVIYNKTGGLFTTGTGLSMHNTTFKVYNGDTGSGGSGGGGVGVSAIFNIGAAFSITDSTEFKLSNYSNGYFNVAGNLVFNSAGNKYLINSGIFNVNNTVNMTGTGNVNHSVDIINNGQFNVTGNISTAINNTGVNIINNTGAILYNGISITLSKSTNTLLNYGEMYTGQDFIVQNGKAYNSNFISVNRDTKVNTGYFENNGYVLNSRNFIVQNQGYVLNNNTLQPFGNLQVNSTSTFVNTSTAQAVPNVSAVVQGTSTIINNGNFATPGIIKVVASTFTNGATANLSSGSDILIQTEANVINSGTLIAGRDLKLTGSTFNNTNYSNIIEEFLPQSSSYAINSGSVFVGTNFRITSSTLTNNHYIYAVNNFSSTNSTSQINNNGYIGVGNEFRNIATVNIDDKALLDVNNYYNTGNGVINGFISSGGISGNAHLVIQGFSQNSGFINNNIIIHDNSLDLTSSNIDYGFDVVSSQTKIATSVLFATKSAGPGNPPVNNCSAMQALYVVYSFASPNPVCPGQQVSLSAQIYKIWKSFLNPFIVVNPVYVWTPGPISGQNITVNPLVTTTYTISVTTAGCTFTSAVTVIVQNVNITTALPASVNKCGNSTSPVVLNGTATGGGTPPYTYLWNPGSSTNPSLPINPSSNITYNLTITDANGCKGMFSTNVIVSNIASVLLASYPMCVGGNVNINATASGGVSPYSYVWNTFVAGPILGPPNNLSPAGNNPLQNATPPATTNYSVQVTDAAGCIFGFQTTVVVNPVPVFNAPFTQFTLPNLPFVLGPTPLASSSSPIITYAWTPSSPLNNAGFQNPTVTNGIAANTTYMATVTNQQGCSATQAYVVNIANSDTYAEFKKIIDGGFYQVQAGKLYFTLGEEYRDIIKLKYTIYDDNKVVKLIHTNPSNPSLPVQLGDNRYYINLVASGFTASDNTKYFSIEIRNEKNELALLKFKYEQ